MNNFFTFLKAVVYNKEKLKAQGNMLFVTLKELTQCM